MRILIVKMSSLGDVVHMLPALTDAVSNIPNLLVDWVVEEHFAAIPAMHPAVRQVIPIGLRRWRKSLTSASTRQEMIHFITQLRLEHYDWIVDTQGLIKSMLVDLLAHGRRGGHAFSSARESISSLCLNKRILAPRDLHAIDRNRLVTAGVLGYPPSTLTPIRYGLDLPAAAIGLELPRRYLVALHGTARAEKEYPAADWATLIARLRQAGHEVLLPWSNAAEKHRADTLSLSGGQVLPRLDLVQLTAIISRSEGVIGVDTGLMHLAAALKRPGIGLYPTTDPALFGVRAEPDAPPFLNFSRLDELDPEHVATTLLALIEQP